MNSNTKKIIAGFAVVVGVYFIYTYFKKPKMDKRTEPSPAPSPSPSPSPSSNDKYPLKKGSKGSNVTKIQKFILGIDPTLLPKFGADGDFGTETEAAIEKLLGKKIVEASDYNTLQTMFNKKKASLSYMDTTPKRDVLGIPSYRSNPFGL